MTERKVQQAREELNQIYDDLKHDLTLCIKFFRKGRPEKVEEYFSTTDWEKINTMLDVICFSFTNVQKMHIKELRKQLHNFYIQPNEGGTTSEKKSKLKSNGSNETTTQEA